jgi:hypothetical protein
MSLLVGNVPLSPLLQKLSKADHHVLMSLLVGNVSSIKLQLFFPLFIPIKEKINYEAELHTN